MNEPATTADYTSRKTPLDYDKLTAFSDEALLEEFCVRKNSSAIEILIHRYESALFNYLFRYLGSREAAEDVFQATFLQVYLKSDQFDLAKRFKPWLYTVATNQAIDYQRRNRRNPTVSLDNTYQDEDGSNGSLQGLLEAVGETPDESMDTEEQAQIVRQAVNSLPESLRQTVNLVYFDDLKYKDAAVILGIPVGTVKSRLHAAMKKLGEFLQVKQ